MRKFYKVWPAILAVMLVSCVEKKVENSYQEQFSEDVYYEACPQETTVVVYDDAGAYQVPGCLMDTSVTLPVETPVAEPTETPAAEEDEEINPDEIEGEFPDVVNNKYQRRQVVMQNLQTRVLAYCRGTDDEMNDCIARLECAGYTQLRNVPTLPAKYDILKKGSYPSRRWRNGENVPRW